eukprot:11176721-Lingulodinium_polyedra.AAC.1
MGALNDPHGQRPTHGRHGQTEPELNQLRVALAEVTPHLLCRAPRNRRQTEMGAQLLPELDAARQILNLWAT